MDGYAEDEHRLLDRFRPAIQFEDAKRDQQSLGRHVVIDGLHRFGTTCLAAAGEFADLNFRLGVDRDSQRVRSGRCLGTGRCDVLEDRVGFGNFFSGRVLRTRRRR